MHTSRRARALPGALLCLPLLPPCAAARASARRCLPPPAAHLAAHARLLHSLRAPPPPRIAPLAAALLAAPAARLNALLGDAPACAALLSVAAAAPEHAPLLQALAQERLPELTLRSRASLLVALALAHGEDTAAAPPPLPPAFAAAALAVLQGTRGLALTRLKEAVNLAHPSLDLHQLVYARLAHAPSRAELLQHLAVEGARVTAARGGAPLAFQVVTDYDDTLQQGWLDARFPRRAHYPGAAALLRELQAAAQARAAAALAADAALLQDACGGEDSASASDGCALHPGWWSGAGAAPPHVPGAAPHGSTLPRRMAARALAPARSAMAAMRGMPPPPAQRALPELLASLLAALEGGGGSEGSGSEGSGSEGSGSGARQGSGAAPPPPPPLPGTLVVLTARPSGPRGIVRRHTLRALAPPAPAPAPADAPPPPPPHGHGHRHVTLLMGSLLRAATTEGIVGAKLDNFATYRSLWPEYSWVLLGDSGQGDAAVGARALGAYGGEERRAAAAAAAPPRQQRLGGGIAAVLIHDVTPLSARTGDGGSKARYAAAGVHFFASYAGAAAGARARGLLDAQAVWRVCEACVEGVGGVEWGALRGRGGEARERALAALLGELRGAGWPGVAGLGGEWARAEARVRAAEGAEAAARAAGLGGGGGEGGGGAGGGGEEGEAGGGGSGGGGEGGAEAHAPAPSERDLKHAAWSGT